MGGMGLGDKTVNRSWKMLRRPWVDCSPLCGAVLSRRQPLSPGFSGTCSVASRN